MRSGNGLALVIAIALTPQVAAAADIYVDDDLGNNCLTATGTAGDPFCTIQEAVDASNPVGDTVRVAAGAYADPVTVSKGVHILGVSGAALTSASGGFVIHDGSSGLTLEGLALSGDGPGPMNAVIDSRPTTVPVSDITIRDCILDGGGVAGRAAFYGHFIAGIWTWDGNEIRNFVSWYVVDNTGSTNDVPYKLTGVVFTGNTVHDVAGSIAFRGKIGQEIETAVVSGNDMDFSMISSLDSECWAALEVNNVLDLTVVGNVVTGVPEWKWSATLGQEGEAFQFWSVAPWTVDIHDNTITGNHMGIWFKGYLADLGGYPLYVPTGSVTGNTFDGNGEFALWIGDSPHTSGLSSAIGGPLDAELNTYGVDDGPLNADDGNGDDVEIDLASCASIAVADMKNVAPAGLLGDAVSENVDYCPWSPLTPPPIPAPAAPTPVLVAFAIVLLALAVAKAGVRRPATSAAGSKSSRSSGTLETASRDSTHPQVG